MQGFLNLNKPSGFTSHDCVAKVRRLLKLKRVGHAGTLDPAAIGVLPIALGKATRLLQFLRQDKSYRATIRFGLRTTTDDLEGEPISEQAVPELELTAIKQALLQFQGVIQQVPPNYSAVQVQGRRLYDLARAGDAIAVQPRQVEIFKLDVLDWRPGQFPELEIAIACGPGTYIRAIARDLGNLLQTGGTLAALTRTTSSGFDLINSLTLDELETQLQQAAFQPIGPELALSHLPAIVLPAQLAQRWCQGQRLSLSGLQFPQSLKFTDPAASLTTVQALRVHHEQGQLLGIGQLAQVEADVLLRPQVVLADF